MYTKLNKFVDVIAYFSLSEWTFYDNNTRSLVDKMSKLDQSLFRCNIAELNWEDYFRRFLLGIRIHILKDPIETLKDGCKRHKKSVIISINNSYRVRILRQYKCLKRKFLVMFTLSLQFLEMSITY